MILCSVIRPPPWWVSQELNLDAFAGALQALALPVRRTHPYGESSRGVCRRALQLPLHAPDCVTVTPDGIHGLTKEVEAEC